MTGPRSRSNRNDRGASFQRFSPLLEIAVYQIPYVAEVCQSAFLHGCTKSDSPPRNCPGPGGRILRDRPNHAICTRRKYHGRVLTTDIVKNFSIWEGGQLTPHAQGVKLLPSRQRSPSTKWLAKACPVEFPAGCSGGALGVRIACVSRIEGRGSRA